MTAIAAKQGKDFVLIVSDVAGSASNGSIDDMHKVWYADNYALAAAGRYTTKFISYLSNNISDLSSKHNDTQALFAEIGKNLERDTKNNSFIYSKDCILSFVRNGINGIELKAPISGNFIGIGNGGDRLATALTMGFADKDILSMSTEEIRAVCEKAMDIVSSSVNFVSKEVRIYLQRKNEQFTFDESPKTTTIECADNKKKVISAIVASGNPICDDRFIFSSRALESIKDQINAKGTPMHFLPNFNTEHGDPEERYIGIWNAAEIFNICGIEAVKAQGIVEAENENITKKLSASVVCDVVKGYKAKDKCYIESVKLLNIAITPSPADALCQVYDASASIDELDSNIIELSGFNIKINNENFLTYNMSEQIKETAQGPSIEIHASSGEIHVDVQAPAIETTQAEQPNIQPPVNTDEPKENYKEKYEQILSENLSMDKQLKEKEIEKTELVSVLNQTADELIKAVKDKNDLQEIITNPKLLQEVAKIIKK